MHRFVRGNKDPAKMTHTIMALVERVLGTKRAHTNSIVSDDDGTGVRVGRGGQVCARVHACQ